MKIDFNLLNPKSNVDMEKTTESKSTTTTKTSTVSGYQLDISGTVMDNAAYGGQGKTKEECMQEVGLNDVALQHNYMAVMSNSLSTEDFNELQKNGYKPGEMKVEETVTVVDEIKVKLAEAGVVIVGYTDTVDSDTVEAITGNKGRAIDIENKLKEHDLPATDENKEEVEKALAQAEKVTQLSDGALKYMVSNDMEPTIENAYLAEHSSPESGDKQGRGFYADDTTGYYARKADTIDFESIKEQVEKVIQEAGLPVNEESMNNAKWLIEKGVPLTVDTLNKLTDMKNIQFPLSEEDLIDSIVLALSEGKSGTKASLISTDATVEKAAEIQQEIQSITEEQVQKVVESGQKLTINNLLGKTSETDLTKAFDAVSAKRILEETRLQMTVEANLKLLKSGYAIETADLEELVNVLKETEKQYYETLFGGSKTADLDQKISLYKETTEKVADLKSMPAALVGKLSATETFTLDQAHTEGASLKSAYDRAGESYEALQTEVRKDLGDSIKKAFRNVDDILTDMKLPLTEDNRKAVRILGYNQMPIDEKSVSKVKEANQKVTSLIDKMTPSAAIELIRKGINPLDVDVTELKSTIEEMQSSDVADAEKYSEYLWKLEKNNEITDEERDAYIGIYRLLNQVQKSDGAVIGSLVNQNADLTMKNLLMAGRSRKSAGMDYTIDDSFGSLQSLNTADLSITDQIEQGFQGQESSESNYYKEAAKEVFEKLDPSKLNQMDLSMETTVDELLDTMRNVQEDVEIKESYSERAADSLRQSVQAEEHVIKALLNFDQPVTPDNLLAAKELMYHRGSLFHKVKEESEKEDSTLEDSIDHFYESFTDEESAVKAYEELKNTAAEILKKAMDKPDIKSIDVRELQLLHKELTLSGNLSKEENFEVPIEIDGEMTSINLRVVHGEETGKVEATLYTEELGSVAAEFRVNENSVEGYIGCSRTEGMDLLSEKKDSMAEKLLGLGKEVKDIVVVQSNSLNINEFGDTETSTNKAETKDLYQIAKIFIETIKEA